jgi:Asp-tRNA(Asn)/Glu-tRNA(Gln) amidotransferase B subunit
MSIDYNKYEAVIGLEVHAQMLNKSKAFCSDAVEYGASPNTLVSPISLGHPGTLPVHNKVAVIIITHVKITFMLIYLRDTRYHNTIHPYAKTDILISN